MNFLVSSLSTPFGIDICHFSEKGILSIKLDYLLNEGVFNFICLRLILPNLLMIMVLFHSKKDLQAFFFLYLKKYSRTMRYN